MPDLVLNEIDYDQVGADAGGFVELYNAGLGPADLEGLARGPGRRRATGTSTCGSRLTRRARRGRLPGRPVDAQNGSPDGVALYDTRSRA